MSAALEVQRTELAERNDELKRKVNACARPRRSCNSSRKS